MRSIRIVCLLVCTVVGLQLILYHIEHWHSGHRYAILMHSFIGKETLNDENESQNTLQNKTKTILWYDEIRQTMIKLSRKANFSKCTFSNCVIKYAIHKQVEKRTESFSADAVAVQGKAIFRVFPPPRRDENQVFILAVRDGFTGLTPRTLARNTKSEQWIHLFNWTMTYRKDSDIVYKYSNIVERNDQYNPLSKNYDNIFTEKKKDVVWLVSHCETKSRREDYVNDLKTVIDVDIYGRCGQRAPCAKGNFSCYQSMAVLLAKRYKFYLAFENTFYDEYVTEKLFEWFNRDIIVVVRGGTNYSTIVPPGTIIDASDFTSATELGRYLKELATDKERYLAYLKRKDSYYSTGRFAPMQEAHCKLCEFLHNLESHRRTYSNIASWWFQGKWKWPRSRSPIMTV